MKTLEEECSVKGEEHLRSLSFMKTGRLRGDM